MTMSAFVLPLNIFNENDFVNLNLFNSIVCAMTLKSVLPFLLPFNYSSCSSQLCLTVMFVRSLFVTSRFLLFRFFKFYSLNSLKSSILVASQKVKRIKTPTFVTRKDLELCGGIKRRKRKKGQVGLQNRCAG